MSVVQQNELSVQRQRVYSEAVQTLNQMQHEYICLKTHLTGCCDASYGLAFATLRTAPFTLSCCHNTPLKWPMVVVNHRFLPVRAEPVLLIKYC
jgi:hypothetical protein